MDILMVILQVLVALFSVLLIMLVLLHKGRGGGVSDMFGGGVSSSMSASGSSQRLLARVTVTTAVLWAVMIVLIGLITRLNVEF